MTSQRNEVANSKAGRTTETKAEPLNISVLQALEAKYNLPVTAFDWKNPIVQILETCLSSISDEDDGETEIVSIQTIPIVFSGSTKAFYPKYCSSKGYVALEDAVILDDYEGYNRIDLSILAALLQDIVNE